MTVNYFLKNSEAATGVFYKKAFLKIFALFTGKHLRWSLFLIQNIAKFLKKPILKNICKRPLWKCAHETKKN